MAKRAKVGGNPYMEFQNSRMEAAKRLATPADLSRSGAMTPQARQRVIEESKSEWAAMAEDMRAAHLDIFRERQRKRWESAATEAAAAAR